MITKEERKAKKETKRIARQNSMLKSKVGPLIVKMSIPTMLSFLITSIYSLADTYFVSSLGTEATAAVSVNTSLDMIIMMGGSMVAVGAASYISRLLGAGDKEKATSVLSTSFFTALLFGLIILIFGKLFISQLVDVLGATATCKQYSMDYATYILYSAPLMAASFVMNQGLRSEGNAIHSTIGMGIGGIINCVLDPIFIFDKFSIFGLTINGLGLEVAGASLATAISKVISFCILFAPYLFRTTQVKIAIRKIKFAKDIVKEVVSVGSSAFFRTGLSIVSGIILNNIAGGISDSLLAAIGVTTKVMMFPFGFLLGFGQGYQPVAGYAWGAKNFKRVKAAYSFAVKTSIIGTIVMAAIMIFFSEELISIFTQTDDELLRLGSLCIILQSIVLPIQAWVMMVNMLCGATGYAFGTVFLALARQGICFIPIVFPIALIFGEYGVCSVQAIADVLTLFLAIPIIKKEMKNINIAEEKFNEESKGRVAKA